MTSTVEEKSGWNGGGGGEIKYKFNFLILHIKFKENSIKTYSAEHSAKCAGEGAGKDK